jgi:metallo-beta-lactamase class B
MLKIIHQSENKARKTRDLTILGLTKVSLPMDAGKIKRMAVFWTEGQRMVTRISKVIGTMIAFGSAAALISAMPSKKQVPRLASDAVIDAAERAPVNDFAISGKWNTPFAPFKVIGNIYYVGSAGVSAYLITSPKGHILMDGILPQTVPQIIANIRTLGFDIHDVKYLINSHAHFDHAGGLAGLQRASGAKMIASAADKPILEAGDIFYGPSAGMHFPPIRVDRIIRDHEQVSLGGITMTAILTPGHTPGCTSWQMTVKGADKAPHIAFFHCSATVAGQALTPESYPGMVANYRATFARVRTLKADVFLANHNNFFDLEGKRARQIAGDANAFVDAAELQRFNTAMEKAFEDELAGEKK